MPDAPVFFMGCKELRLPLLIPLLGVFLTIEESEEFKSSLIPRIIALLVKEDTGEFLSDDLAPVNIGQAAAIKDKNGRIFIAASSLLFRNAGSFTMRDSNGNSCKGVKREIPGDVPAVLIECAGGEKLDFKAVEAAPKGAIKPGADVFTVSFVGEGLSVIESGTVIKNADPPLESLVSISINGGMSRIVFDKKGRAAGVIISAGNEKSGNSLMYPFHALLKEISIDQKKTD